MPGLCLICLLTSFTIPNAALPTDLIVNAENMYGNMAPINRPAQISGCANDIWDILSYNPELCKKPPNKDRDTNAADPIANPFPIAAVVLPAASSPSVLYLTSGPISAIYAIPPALSLIGPQPSIAKLKGKLDNIPNAANETP